MRVLLSAFFWVYLALSLTVFWFAVAIPWLCSLPFDRRRRFAHWYACVWANHYISLSPFWETEVTGLDRFDKNTSYVIAANHQSIADIMVMFTTFRQFRWVSKHTVFYVPFMGWMMKMANYVGIRRGDPRSRQKMMDACRAHLNMGNSIMIFPEGTRSEDRQIRPFKRGAFQLAVDTQRPVLPILLDGTHDALPKDTWIFRQQGKQKLQIHVLEPVDPADFDHDPERLKRHVRAVMIDGLAALRARSAALEPGTDRPRSQGAAPGDADRHGRGAKTKPKVPARLSDGMRAGG